MQYLYGIVFLQVDMPMLVLGSSNSLPLISTVGMDIAWSVMATSLNRKTSGYIGSLLHLMAAEVPHCLEAH